MTERALFMKLFDISVNTYYNWKKENRPIMKLLEKYFTKEDLEEFLKTGQIAKLETLGRYEYKQNYDFTNFYSGILRTQTTKNYSILEIREKLANFRLFWDFIARYKNELKNIQYQECRKSINKYLLDYHLVLIELCKIEYKEDLAGEVERATFNTTQYYNTFMLYLTNISDELLFYLVQNIQSNFRPYINYLLNSNIYPYAIDILACSTIDYYDEKFPINKEVNGVILLNDLNSRFENIDRNSKEYYFIIEDYLKKYEEKREEIINMIKSAPNSSIKVFD